jgi:hypothetical protein
MSTFSERTVKQRQPIIAATVLSGTILLSALLLCSCNSAQTDERTPFHALGEVGADQVASLLAGKGKIVVVAWDNKSFGSQSLDAQLDAFRDEAKKTGLNIVATEFMTPDSPAMLGLNTLSPQQYFDVIYRHSDVDGIVSFIGLPALQDDEIARLPGRLPKCAVIGVQREQKLKNLFEHNALQMAILLRANPSMSGSPKSTREWFDRYYQIVNSASELP